MAAGMATLKGTQTDGFYEELGDKVTRLTAGLKSAAQRHGIPLATNQAGGMFGLFFTDQQTITRFDQVVNCDGGRFNTFFHQMLDEGVYLAPSAYEAGFVSAAHSADDINQTLSAAERVFGRLAA